MAAKRKSSWLLLALLSCAASSALASIPRPDNTLQPITTSDRAARFDPTHSTQTKITINEIEPFDSPAPRPLFVISRKHASGLREVAEENNISEASELDAESCQGHDYMHARYYNPNLGRFLSVDPVLDLDRAMRRPQGWNRYAYVENNPIKNIDPDGRAVETLWDVFNVAVGMTSLGANVASGNVVGALVDVGGLAFDLGATVAPGVPGGASSAIKAARLAENARAGRAFEAAVLDALGASKNSGGVSEIATRVTTIPDLPIGKLHGVTDIKNVRNLSLDKQLQAQISAARTGSLPFNLIVSTRTQTISKPLYEAITRSKGKIFVYDDNLKKFHEATVVGNKLRY